MPTDDTWIEPCINRQHIFQQAGNEVRLLISCLAYQVMHIARRAVAKATGTGWSLRRLRASACCGPAIVVSVYIEPNPQRERTQATATPSLGAKNEVR
jgi:hypothetical protein